MGTENQIRTPSQTRKPVSINPTSVDWNKPTRPTQELQTDRNDDVLTHGLQRNEHAKTGNANTNPGSLKTLREEN